MTASLCATQRCLRPLLGGKREIAGHCTRSCHLARRWHRTIGQFPSGVRWQGYIGNSNTCKAILCHLMASISLTARLCLLRADFCPACGAKDLREPHLPRHHRRRCCHGKPCGKPLPSLLCRFPQLRREWWGESPCLAAWSNGTQNGWHRSSNCTDEPLNTLRKHTEQMQDFQWGTPKLLVPLFLTKTNSFSNKLCHIQFLCPSWRCHRRLRHLAPPLALLAGPPKGLTPRASPATGALSTGTGGFGQVRRADPRKDWKEIRRDIGGQHFVTSGMEQDKSKE